MSDSPQDNFHPDDNPEHGWHADLTRILPELGEYGGSDQVRVDPYGNVMGGTTHIGQQEIDWNPEA